MALAVVAALVIGLGASFGIHNRVVFGEFYSAGAPPRIEYCGRRYYRTERILTLVQVKEDLAANNLGGLTRVDSTPSGMPVVANVLSPAQRAAFSSNVCTMILWVQTGPDAYVTYGISGGP